MSKFDHLRDESGQLRIEFITCTTNFEVGILQFEVRCLDEDQIHADFYIDTPDMVNYVIYNAEEFHLTEELLQIEILAALWFDYDYHNPDSDLRKIVAILKGKYPIYYAYEIMMILDEGGNLSDLIERLNHEFPVEHHLPLVHAFIFTTRELQKIKDQ